MVSFQHFGKIDVLFVNASAGKGRASAAARKSHCRGSRSRTTCSGV